ncbi:MAG: hypothetical protein WCH75_00030 [Candidatus Binatia bacterium]
MIYLATYNHKKPRVQQADYKSKRLIFITAEDRLTLDKVVALIKKLTEGDLEESTVEIIGQRGYDPKTISNPLVTFYRVD